MAANNPPGYVPEEGHVLHLDFGPVRGHEQDGLRFGVVLSPAVLNKSGMCIIVPMTTRVSGHPSEVPTTSFNNGKAGVALPTQVTALDWREREAAFKGTITLAELFHIRHIVRSATGSLPKNYQPPR